VQTPKQNACSSSEAFEFSIRSGEILDGHCRKFAEHKTRRLPTLGSVRAGDKTAVSGISESASEAFEQGIRCGEIQDNYGENLYSYRLKFAERELRLLPEKCSVPEGRKITVGAILSLASVMVRSSTAPVAKPLSIKRGTSPKIGTVRVGRKVAIGGIAESASEAFELGIGRGEIRDSYYRKKR